MQSGLKFNFLVGLFGSLIFLIINKFKIEITLYSSILAIVMTIFAIVYIIISFKILAEGKTAYYTLFRMTGAMLVPYEWGIFVLNEEVSLLRILGMILIIASIFLINAGKNKLSVKNTVMCISVFFLAGFVSVISKQHAISEQAISPVGYVIITSLVKVILCGVLLVLMKEKRGYHNEKHTVKHSSSLCYGLCFASAFSIGMAYMIQLICAKNMPATILYPVITGGTIIFSAIFARLFFKEKLPKKGIAAIIICFIGTALYI